MLETSIEHPESETRLIPTLTAMTTCLRKIAFP